MNRKLVLAVFLASLLTAPALTAHADGDDKKPEQPQLLADGGPERQDSTDLIIVADGGLERQDSTDLIILSDGDDKKNPEQPQLV